MKGLRKDSIQPIHLAKHTFNNSSRILAENERYHERLTLLLNSSNITNNNNNNAAAAATAATNNNKWTSHSVLVVDMSGSMCRDDVNGARCRSDGVWLSIARDYIKIPLENGTRNHFDLVSIILMQGDDKESTGDGDAATVIIQTEPTTWILYNKVVELREWTRYKPAGHGYYLPAIELAETLLLRNTNTTTATSCALSLLFVSDGKPSDQCKSSTIAQRIGQVASRFGRRLSITCIGMANDDEDFSCLQSMVHEASQYGAISTFGKSNLDVNSLSNMVTTLATSLTTSRIELTELTTGRCKSVRMDIEREKLITPDWEGSWKYYTSNNCEQRVNRFWTWNNQTNNFVAIVDRRCMYCFTEKYVYHTCSGCNAKFVCKSCYQSDSFASHGMHYRNRPSQCEKLLTNIQKGNLVHKDEHVLPTFSLAIKTQTFGEGAERIVRKVRFLDSNGVFVGPMMVAKESRFVEYHYGNNYQQQLDYHTNFMRTQYIASSFAKLYNMAVTDARNHYFGGNDKQQDLLRLIPKIHFIEPMIVDLIEKNDKGEKNILIERYLEGEYKKFNNNAGYVEDEVKWLVNRMNITLGLGSNSLNNRSNDNDIGLGAIAEDSGEEDDDESDDDVDEINETYNNSNSKQIAPHRELKCSIDTLFSLLNQDACFPQAFSHFTYEKSKRKLMVVDLQGVFTVNKADGTKVYELTDPVIHQRPSGKKSERKMMNFGRTDRGIMGMKAFFETHECTDACKFLGLSEVKVENVK